MSAGDLITGEYQIEWAGLLFGATPLYGIRSLTGWLDLPTERLGVESRSNRHGAYPGQYFADSKTITAQLLIRGLPANFIAGVKALRRVTAFDENAAEQPFIARWGDGRKLMVMARCARRDIPSDSGSYPQGVALATIQWVASDPRMYELPGNNFSTALAVASGGIVFPLVFPLDFGAGTSGGKVLISNNGNAQAWPVFNLTGPLTAPALTDQLTGRVLGFKTTTVIPAGQTWQVDTNRRTVTVLGTTVSRNNELLTRQWFSVPGGGSTTVVFTSQVYDAGAALSAFLYNTDL